MITLYALVLMFCPGECQRVETPFAFKSEQVCYNVGAIEVGRRRIKIPVTETIDFWMECIRQDPRPELASDEFEYYDQLERTALLK
jgi:hypothetical protein